MANQYGMSYTPQELAKIAKGLCRVKNCRNKRPKQKTLCYKHRHERRKETDPIGYWYEVHKNNAKRRGKEYTLTKDQFASFVKSTDYIKLKGKGKHNLCIDRRDNEHGYHVWNIRAITLRDNSIKRNYVDYYTRQETEWYERTQGGG